MDAGKRGTDQGSAGTESELRKHRLPEEPNQQPARRSPPPFRGWGARKWHLASKQLKHNRAKKKQTNKQNKTKQVNHDRCLVDAPRSAAPPWKPPSTPWKWNWSRSASSWKRKPKPAWIWNASCPKPTKIPWHGRASTSTSAPPAPRKSKRWGNSATAQRRRPSSSPASLTGVTYRRQSCRCCPVIILRRADTPLINWCWPFSSTDAWWRPCSLPFLDPSFSFVWFGFRFRMIIILSAIW